MKLSIRSIIVATFIISLGARASDAIPAKPQDHPIVIVDATIHPVVGPVVEKG